MAKKAPAEDEQALLYDLETDDRSSQVLGGEISGMTAQMLPDAIRHNVTVDLLTRQRIPAIFSRRIRRVIRKHGCRPEKRKKATLTVLLPAPAP